MNTRSIILAALATFSSWPPPSSGSTRSASADIAFASRRDGNWEIYVTDEAGRDQQRLSRRDGEDRFPLWSPDHRQIAFCSQVAGTWELWTMDSDGANQRRLALNIIVKSTRGWSPDSKQIAYTAVANENVDVYVVDVQSGQITRLTSSSGDDRDPAWSPDGLRLTFSSARGGAPPVYVAHADGGGVQQITSTVSAAETPRWSPNGRSILFVSARDLYVIGADGQHLRQITAGAHVTRDPPLWSPDGTRIAFQVADATNYDIGVVQVAGGIRSVLANSAAYDGSYTWSYDGKRIAFVSDRDGLDAIYVVDVADERTVRLTTTASLTPAWGSQR